jgi:2-methylisocitrate lyase-like PEP mutase family enzyme
MPDLQPSARRLRAPLDEGALLSMPCCFDALSARLIEQAGCDLEEGITPILPPVRLAELGYRIAAYPLTLIASAVQAMREALKDLAGGRTPQRRVDFQTLQDLLGFDAYDRLLAAYGEDRGPDGPLL